MREGNLRFQKGSNAAFALKRRPDHAPGGAFTPRQRP
jgi:hypothetical protein